MSATTGWRPSFVNRPPEQNRIGGRWHYTRSNGWTYQDPVNRVETWCGEKAENPPYRVSSYFLGPETEVDCEPCKVAVRQAMETDVARLRL